jgi:hypothetical protein
VTGLQVHVRSRPSLRSKPLGVLPKGRFVQVDRETDHWVRLRAVPPLGGGWVLKRQQKYGPLLAPVKQQHYEHNYVPAATVGLDRLGRVVKPLCRAASSNGVEAAAPLDESPFGVLVKRVVVEPLAFNKSDPAPPPPPPPKGWEVLYDRVSGKNYYASLRGHEVRWEVEGYERHARV